MFQYYLKIAVRNLIKEKAYVSINIVGLAIGMASCFLILLFVKHELGYDKFHKNSDRIYRIIREHTSTEGSFFDNGSSGVLAPMLLNEFPEIESAVRICQVAQAVVSHDQKVFRQPVMIADAEVLDIFTLGFVMGDSLALQEPFSVLITKELATKLFEDQNPLGETLQISNLFGAENDYKITGVLQDVPQNSTLNFECITSMVPKKIRNDFWTKWVTKPGWLPISTYILLKDQTNYKELEIKISESISRRSEQSVGKNLDYHLQPLPRIYLYSKSDYGFDWVTGDITSIYLFSGIAILILCIASINFINLATACASKRKKEVGLRKVLGARRFQLIGQFWSESILQCFFILLLSFVLSGLALSTFRNFTERELVLFSEDAMVIGIGLAIFAAIISVLSGLYLALFLSKYQLGEIPIGRMENGSRAFGLRSLLIIFQFSVCVTLIIATLVIDQQLHFIGDFKLGFNKQHVVMLPFKNRSQYETKKDAFLQHPNILKASSSMAAPGYSGMIYPIRAGYHHRPLQMRRMFVDSDFLDTYEIKVVRGRSFRKGNRTDQKTAFLLNETAVKQLGWDDPIGKEFEWVNGNMKGTVIGVVKDFHYRSLRDPIPPTFMIYQPGQFLSLRLRTGNMALTLGFIEQTWKAFHPNDPFEFIFVDDVMDRLYRADKKLGQVCRAFSFLGIFVACLGLLGLATFMVERQRKEIGIRKVLGASVLNVVLMLSKDFGKLIVIAIVISWLIAYFMMDVWLEEFTFRIGLQMEVFVVGATLVAAIAFGTIVYQVFKAANTNPIDALRNE